MGAINTDVNENWIDISGYYGKYSVSDFGRIKNNATGKIMSLGINNKSTYVGVVLVLKGIRTHRRIHRIVCESFIGKCPKNKEVSHLDGNSKNNALSNLAYETSKNNSNRKKEHGTLLRGEKHPNCKISQKDVLKIRELSKSGISQNQISKLFPVRQQQLSRIINRKRWGSV